VKVSKSRASANRDAIVTAAASQIRGHGLEPASVAEVAKAAGLTTGAVYSHFPSKDALAAEAMACAFDECVGLFGGLNASKFLQRYLSKQHLDNPGNGCPAAALVSEIARQPEQVQTAFRDGVNRFIKLTDVSLKAADAETGGERAVLVYAAIVGALALARAIHGVDESRADSILRSVNRQLRHLVES
jgi:TetR/AcrR family transcriptional regulator, transcriptional repressor for nem operon